MTHKRFALAMSATAICLAMTFTSCKKKEEPEPEPEPTTQTTDENGQSGTDSREAQAENDQAVTEINEAMSSNQRVSGKAPSGTEGQLKAKGSLCGLTVDSLLSNTGIIKLNYNGTTCNNRTRTGAIRLTLQGYSNGVRWKDANAVIKVEYLNYKITRASDQKSMTFVGVQYLTNVSGGNWITLFFNIQPSLVSTITGTNLAVTFQDNKTATYNINRRVTYTYTNSVLSAKAEGIGSFNNLNDLENYGTTRDGDAFTSQVTTPIIWNTTCGGGAPIQGALNIKVASKNFDLKFTYGVDASGNPVTVGANQCPFGWKLQWTVNANTNNKVIGYF